MTMKTDRRIRAAYEPVGAPGEPLDLEPLKLTLHRGHRLSVWESRKLIDELDALRAAGAARPRLAVTTVGDQDAYQLRDYVLWQVVRTEGEGLTWRPIGDVRDWAAGDARRPQLQRPSEDLQVLKTAMSLDGRILAYFYDYTYFDDVMKALRLAALAPADGAGTTQRTGDEVI